MDNSPRFQKYIEFVESMGFLPGKNLKHCGEVNLIIKPFVDYLGYCSDLLCNMHKSNFFI